MSENFLIFVLTQAGIAIGVVITGVWWASRLSTTLFFIKETLEHLYNAFEDGRGKTCNRHDNDIAIIKEEVSYLKNRVAHLSRKNGTAWEGECPND